MRLKTLFAAAAIIASATTPAWAGATDGEGFPVMYLRGAKIGAEGQWNAIEQYRFNREGSTYTLHLDNLDGEFKIANDDWSYDFGADADENGKVVISSSATVTAVKGGKNFGCPGVTDITITFDYTDGNSTPVVFTVSGERPPVAGLSGRASPARNQSPRQLDPQRLLQKAFQTQVRLQTENARPLQKQAFRHTGPRR